MIACRVVVVSEVVAELAFKMKLPGIHDVDVSALYPETELRPHEIRMELIGGGLFQCTEF